MFDTVPALRRTALADLHMAQGGRLVPFAGWHLPLQFPTGIIAEVRHCRTKAALFDVSHMLQIELFGAGAAERLERLERLVPADLQRLTTGHQRYTQFLTAQGGIIDDLIVGRLPDRLRLVVNASSGETDLAHLSASLPPDMRIVARTDLALLALQGPLAAQVLQRHTPGIAALPFMGVADITLRGVPAVIARCGYTGEDGFEIALPTNAAAAFAERLLAEPEVSPAGLGARDALRLEAGLCLYGQELDEGTTPIEAGLGWSIGRRRRQDGGFPGDAVIRAQLAHGAPRRLVGVRPDGKAPARTGATIFAGERAVGQVTSGGFSPTLNAPIALAFVRADAPTAGLSVALRDRRLAAPLSPLPFVAKNYALGDAA